jgi:hypothetical protein
MQEIPAMTELEGDRNVAAQIRVAHLRLIRSKATAYDAVAALLHVATFLLFAMAVGWSVWFWVT